MEPPLHFGEEKMRKKERKKRGKKKAAPPLIISGFATGRKGCLCLVLVE